MGAGTAYKVPGRADSRSKFSEIRQTPLRRDIIDRTTDPRARLPLGPDVCSPANSLGKRGTSASSATHWEASADFARGARLLLAFLRNQHLEEYRGLLLELGQQEQQSA